MLGRVQAGELNNAAAAKALGIKVGAWGVWKSGYQRRTGSTKVARRGRQQMTPENPLAGLLAQLEGLQRFGEELRDRVRAMAELVEGRFPG